VSKQSTGRQEKEGREVKKKKQTEAKNKKADGSPNRSVIYYTKCKWSKYTS
jgi:hypothetical protein